MTVMTWMSVLWVGARQKRIAQFEAVRAEYAGAMDRLAAAYAAKKGEQEDLAQEIMLALWQALPSYRGEASMRTFVYRVAHNRCIDLMRKGRLPMAHAKDLEVLSSPLPSPERAVSAQQDLEEMARMLRTLPGARRQALLLSLEGFSHQEIADITGASLSAVAVRIHRARDSLRLTPKKDEDL